jgi:acyl-CoA thioesterase-1
MKKIMIWGVILTSMLLSWCKNDISIDTTTNGDTSAPQKIVTIFALWDSLTAWYQLPIEQSWPSQLQRLLEAWWFKNYKVVNGGKSWDTSQQLKDRLSRTTEGIKPWDIVVLTIWGNDGFQSVPVRMLDANIRDMVRELQWKWAIIILWWMQISTNLWSTYTSAFAAIYPKIAKDTKSILIPFFLEWVALMPQYNLADMIHPNEAWYGLIAQNVFDTLNNNNLLIK